MAARGQYRADWSGAAVDGVVAEHAGQSSPQSRSHWHRNFRAFRRLASEPAPDVTVYERADRVGGHSNTVLASVGGRSIPVDTGFIVFNPRTYPNLTALFEIARGPDPDLRNVVWRIVG